MKIKILKSTVADDRFVRAGSVEDISERDAVLLIRLGKAVAVDALPPAPTIMTTENVSGAIAEDKPKRGRPARFSNAGK